MNDPGLDAPIAEESKEVEKRTSDEVQGEDPDGVDDDEAYLTPSRWWFASTAIPLIAGTFGPMASAFNICALAARWRVTIATGESEDDGTSIPDPQWLIAVNAVSLVIALIANLALLFNMARRLPFTIAQPITIIGWYISSFLLIGLVVAAHLVPSFQLPIEEDPAMTQAFYYAIQAAVLYFIISTLMCFTVYGAYKGHYPMAFKLTISQRTLMIQTISYLVYLLAGGAVFAHIEDWLFLNGVYWANTTLLTIGTGDFSPTTHLGQGLIFPYAIGGIVHIGLVIGSIRSLILERGKKKLGVRMVEKKREKIIAQMDKNDGVVRVSLLTNKRNLMGGQTPEQERRKAEFEVMRMIQEHASMKRKWISFSVSLSAWFFLWFIGAVVFWIAERRQQGMTYFEALYFAYISLLTIGYGDYAPVANASKAFFVFWSLLAVPTLTLLISNMGDTVIKLIKDATMLVSELTVLPGDKSTTARLKTVANHTMPKPIFDRSEEPVEESAGGAAMPEQDRDLERGKKARHSGLQKAADRLGRDWQEEELEEIEEAQRRGDQIGDDKHLYHYLLVREIRKVMRNVGSTPLHKYTYREWSWFLRLLGEDERDADSHRKPPIDTDVDTVAGMPKLGNAEKSDEGGKALPRSWVGTRSPLMGDLDESEWLLERLSEKLELLLHEEHQHEEHRSGKHHEASDKQILHQPVKDTGTGRELSKSDSGRTLEEE